MNHFSVPVFLTECHAISLKVSRFWHVHGSDRYQCEQRIQSYHRPRRPSVVQWQWSLVAAVCQAKQSHAGTRPKSSAALERLSSPTTSTLGPPVTQQPYQVNYIKLESVKCIRLPNHIIRRTKLLKLEMGKNKREKGKSRGVSRKQQALICITILSGFKTAIT